MELLRFITAGSVDDGKSTLVGRLLYDSKAIPEDQMAAVERASVQYGHGQTDLALLTDGLRAEREQGITIDVAYRYFATSRRKFIIADTPGHVQYTRNMVTGASTANLAVILLDARKGVLEQSRRHASIASLLRIPHVVVAVNKMDLVGWDEGVFRTIADEFTDFAARLPFVDLAFIPMSALHGDNVVEGSDRMRWYRGLPLLQHLEDVHIASDRNLVDARFPVQRVVRPAPGGSDHHRRYAGQVAGGMLRPGDEVMVLPAGLNTTVTHIDTFDGPVDEAIAGMSVTLQLADDLDVCRGDMICRPTDGPTVGQDIEAMVCWLDDRALRPDGRYAIKQTTRWARAVVRDLRFRLDVNTLDPKEGIDRLDANDIGRLRLRTTSPMVYDSYERNRATGSFILVDETTNATVGAGMILA